MCIYKVSRGQGKWGPIGSFDLMLFCLGLKECPEFLLYACIMPLFFVHSCVYSLLLILKNWSNFDTMSNICSVRKVTR